MRPEVLTRQEAIARLSKRLAALTGPQKSACRFAADEKVLCRGFARFTDEQLRQRYGFLGDGDTPRAELERRADEWHVGRGEMERAPTACDVQQQFVETCRGWNEFTNQELARFCRDICGDRVVVIGHRMVAAVI
jgi:hypothetical protein